MSLVESPRLAADALTIRSNAVVHVRAESETEMDLLFSVLNNNEPKQSYRSKNLPLSFFQPPKPRLFGHHSREVSLDYISQSHQDHGERLVTYHNRSHSSPAKLPVSLSLIPSTSAVEQFKGGRVYGSCSSSTYISAMKTSWADDPQDASMIGNQDSQCMVLPDGLAAPSAAAGAASSVTNQQLDSLPPGWDQAITAEGEIYFIDHINKKTSWYDPRLPKHLQKQAVSRVRNKLSVPVQHQCQDQLHQHDSMQTSQRPGLPSLPPHHHGHVQPVTACHLATRQPNRLVHQQCMTTPFSPLSAPGMMPGSSLSCSQPPLRNSLNVENRIQQKLREVRENKERLCKLQEECCREEQRLMRELLSQTKGVAIASVDGLPADIMSASTHFEQEQLQQPLLLQQQLQQQTQPLNGISSSLSLVDVSSFNETSGDQMPMDSDDLVSSLTDEFGRDLLTMDIQMSDIFL